MSKIIPAIARLAEAVGELAHQQSRASIAINDVAREQRITNLIVRAQTSNDPAEAARLMHEASTRMDAPRRRSPHDPL